MENNEILEKLNALDSQTNERCTNIEIKLSFMEEFIQKLQEEVVKQGKIIEKLTNENHLISEKLKDLSDSLEEIPNRRPPHY